MQEEAQAKFDWLRSLNSGLEKKFERLKTAGPAERIVLEREIAGDVSRAERLSCFVLSCEWPTPPAADGRAPTQGAIAPPQPKLGPIPPQGAPAAAGPDAGLFQEEDGIRARIRTSAFEQDPNGKVQAAMREFGTGKAAAAASRCIGSPSSRASTRDGSHARRWRTRRGRW